VAKHSGGGRDSFARPEAEFSAESSLEAAHGPGEPMEKGIIRRLKREESDLRQSLTEARGNLTQAARQLGISRQLLSYRLLKHGLDYRDFKKTR
jgi:arginine utilization regulatory protein